MAWPRLATLPEKAGENDKKSDPSLPEASAPRIALAAFELLRDNPLPGKFEMRFRGS